MPGASPVHCWSVGVPSHAVCPSDDLCRRCHPAAPRLRRHGNVAPGAPYRRGDRGTVHFLSPSRGGPQLGSGAERNVTRRDQTRSGSGSGEARCFFWGGWGKEGENGRGAGGLGLCAFIGTGTGKHQSARAHSHFSLMRRCLLSFSSSTPYTYIHAPQAAPSRPLFPLPRFSWTRPFLSSSPLPPCPLPRSASHPPTLRVAFLSFPPRYAAGDAGLRRWPCGTGQGRSGAWPGTIGAGPCWVGDA